MKAKKNIDEMLHSSEKDALRNWARQVQENREQAERWRENPADMDFYAPTASAFKTDPFRMNDNVLQVLKSMAFSDESWIDIGAGAGRYAIPLALMVREIIAIEPSQSMLSFLQESIKEYNVRNIRIVADRWPLKNAPRANVAFISHVGYDIEDIGLFLDAMELSASRLCVAVLRESAPSGAAERYWPLIHGEKRLPLPALPEFLSLQTARGQLCEVTRVRDHHQALVQQDRRISFLRQQLFIQPGGRKDKLLQQIVDQETSQSNPRLNQNESPSMLGIVSWTPIRKKPKPK